jgi:sugar/nucleoside kinase (ribokinase family)
LRSRAKCCKSSGNIISSGCKNSSSDAWRKWSISLQPQEELAAFARFGNAVASLCVEKKGAILAMPNLAQVEKRLGDKKWN